MRRLHWICSFLILTAYVAAYAPLEPTAESTMAALPTATVLPRAATGSAVATSSGTPAASEEPIVATPTETSLPSPISLYPNECMDALRITLQNVGQTLCVGGLVFYASQVHGDMYVAFSSDQSKFYMMGYDWNGAPGFNEGDCVYATAPVEKLGSVPVMRVNPSLLHACTPPPYPTPTPPAALPSGCRFALDVNLNDYGKKMCVGGVAAFVNAHEDVREIYFSLVLSMGLHLVIRGMSKTDREVNPGECIFVNNHKVDKTGLILVMAIQSAEVQRCSQASTG